MNDVVPKGVENLSGNGTEAMKAEAERIEVEDSSKDQRTQIRGELPIIPSPMTTTPQAVSTTPDSTETSPETELTNPDSTETSPETELTNPDSTETSAETELTNSDSIRKFLEKEGLSENKYTKLIMDNIEGTGFEDHKLVLPLLLFAAKYGDLFDTISNIGKSFTERISSDDYQNENLEIDEAQKLSDFSFPDGFDFTHLAFQKNNLNTQAASTKFLANLIFGNKTPSGFSLSDNEIIDPYQLAAKLKNGGYEMNESNPKKVLLENFTNIPAGSVVFFRVENKENKTTNTSTNEDVVSKSMGGFFNSGPLISGVLDGNGNIVYYGPSKDETDAKIRTVKVSDFKDKAYTFTALMTKNIEALSRISKGLPATEATSTDESSETPPASGENAPSATTDGSEVTSATPASAPATTASDPATPASAPATPAPASATPAPASATPAPASADVESRVS